MIPDEVYDDYSIWMTDLVKYPSSILPLSTVPAALCTICLFPYILTGLFLWLSNGSHDLSFVVILALAASIPVMGPIFVWHYDENVFPGFIREVQDVITDTEALVETVNRYEQFFTEKSWLITLPWTALITGAVIANLGYFKDVGVTGLFDPAFLVFLVLAIWWSVVTSIGLHGALTTILCVKAVGNHDLEIDPLHHDGLGGLSTIGYFSIRATVMNSIGSFALPLGFAIAAGGGYQSLIYTAVVCYIGFILISFLYPTLYINSRAQEVRDGILRDKRQQIRELEDSMSVDSNKGEMSELETQLKIQTLRDDFHEYQSVNLYPLSISIITRLASSILLPIAFTLLETYVFAS